MTSSTPSPPPPDLQIRRLSTRAWDALCVAAEATQRPAPEVIATVTEAGLTTPDGRLDTRWLSLTADYLSALLAVEVTSHFDGQIFRTHLALGPTNTAVTRRCVTDVVDGVERETGYDDQLEIAVSSGHPWPLVERLLPPLPPLHAPLRDTPPSRVRPIAVTADTPSRVQAWLAEHPQADAAAALAAVGTPAVRDLVDARAHTVYQFNWGGPRPGSTAAWYAASETHLYRATFRADAPFAEVNPGDLGVSFHRHLTIALTELDAARRDLA